MSRENGKFFMNPLSPRISKGLIHSVETQAFYDKMKQREADWDRKWHLAFDEQYLPKDAPPFKLALTPVETDDGKSEETGAKNVESQESGIYVHSSFGYFEKMDGQDVYVNKSYKRLLKPASPEGSTESADDYDYSGDDILRLNGLTKEETGGEAAEPETEEETGGEAAEPETEEETGGEAAEPTQRSLLQRTAHRILDAMRWLRQLPGNRDARRLALVGLGGVCSAVIVIGALQHFGYFLPVPIRHLLVHADKIQYLVK